MLKLKNDGATTLAADINSSATSITVIDGSVFPTLDEGDWFPLVIIKNSNVERMRVTARSANVLTVTRGAEGTTARAWVSGDNCTLNVTAEALDDLKKAVGIIDPANTSDAVSGDAVFKHTQQVHNVMADISITSAQLHDAADADNVSGLFVNWTTGNLQANVSYITSNFIPVTALLDYTFSELYCLAWYTSDKQFITGVQSTATTHNAPDNAAWVRFSPQSGTDTWDGVMVTQSSAVMAYVAYGSTINNDKIESLPTGSIADNAVTEEKTSFMVPTKNVFNAATLTSGFMSEQGAVTASDGYYHTDFMKLEAGETYVSSFESGGDVMRFVTAFDAGFIPIPSEGSNSPVSSINVPGNGSVAYYRITIHAGFLGEFMLEKGTVVTTYVPFAWELDPSIRVTTLESEAYVLPASSFSTIESLSSRDKGKNDPHIPNWDRAYNVLSSYSNITDDVFNCGGSADLAYSAGWLSFGFDMKHVNYATENKTYAIVLEGTIIAQNVDDFQFSLVGGVVGDISQDLVDGVQRAFKVVLEFSYSAGYTGTSEFAYTKVTRRDNAIPLYSYDAQFTTFAIFERQSGFTVDDYIKANNGGIIIPINSAKGTATEAYVDTKVSTALGNVSKLTPNDLTPAYDIEMFLSGGQSLNVGGGASSATADFKNSPSFAGGSDLYGRAFTTQAEKDAFFGSDFRLIEGNGLEQYPPLTAALTTMLSLLAAENNVDVSAFGYQMLPLTWGVSGGSITAMNKGTTAYNDMIECVTKAKEFANKEGKTFGVVGMSWYQGESDRNYTKQAYYDLMSQLFIDVDTDVKAITGQAEDVEFFTYQTSPWLGRIVNEGTPMTQMNVQEAQVQVATDYANVHIAGAMYQFEYNGDFYHPVDRAVVGLQTGVSIKRVLHDNEAWVDFKPLSHQVITDGTNFYTHLKFAVPVKPARFDLSADAWHNPKGKQPNFGFELLSGGIEKQTAEPFITKGDTVILTSTEDPTGMTIRYAVNGHDGGGNLCDSQNITIRNKSVDYVIDNFAVGFSEYSVT
jgi:hypothetical protein